MSNRKGLWSLLLLLSPLMVWAADDQSYNFHLTDSVEGLIALVIFAIAYVFVMAEEFVHLRKSKPVVFAAGLIWICVALEATSKGITHEIDAAVSHVVLEFAELFLFLLVAMTYIAALEDRRVFDILRVWLMRKKFSYRQLFWITGALAFVISPIADNLTTSLLMCAVVMAMASDHPKFVSLSCINIVVAANAGGAFSPFGDITTLMVWQKNHVHFQEFFAIFIPALFSYLIPAAIMYFAVPKVQPSANVESVRLRPGGIIMTGLFLLTVTITIVFHTFLHLPPVMGMMTGFGLLMLYSYFIKNHERQTTPDHFHVFDIFAKVKSAEWDTLFFFYGVIVCVGGLATFGYLELASKVMYSEWGAGLSVTHAATPANIVVGFLSAIIDNIPVMYAVLTMQPDMALNQWLLVTLTAGVGGSLLATGSAAGVALMGQSQGQYTFFSHLKWSWAIVLGYVAGVACHLWLNF